MACFSLQHFRNFILLLVLGLISACSSYKPFQDSNIKAVYVLYTDTSYYHPKGYKLDNGSIVHWDRNLNGIVAGLNNNRHRYTTLKKQGSGYLTPLIKNKIHWRYLPIKVIGLEEFGYIELKNDEVIYYGLMNKTLIDLTNRQVYGEKDR
jgi:hypothetical protein